MHKITKIYIQKETKMLIKMINRKADDKTTL